MPRRSIFPSRKKDSSSSAVGIPVTLRPFQQSPNARFSQHRCVVSSRRRRALLCAAQASCTEFREYRKFLVTGKRIGLYVGDDLQCQRLRIYRFYSANFLRRPKNIIGFPRKLFYLKNALIHGDDTNPLRFKPFKPQHVLVSML